MIDATCDACGHEYVAQPVAAHRLLCGDSLSEITRILGGEVIGCTFTSPPYAVGVDYGHSYTDDIASLRALLPRLASATFAHTLEGGAHVVNFGDVVSGSHIVEVDDVCEYPMAVEYWPVYRAAGWFLHTRRVWAKPHARVHSPWAIQSSRAASDWEHLWTWRKPGRARVARGEFSAFGVWDSTSEHGVDVGKDVHGAGMAVVIAVRSLLTHSRNDDVVFEPFAGTGTTYIAAEQTGRSCYGGELNPAYCDVVVRRWERVSGREAVRDRR